LFVAIHILPLLVVVVRINLVTVPILKGYKQAVTGLAMNRRGLAMNCRKPPVGALGCRDSTKGDSLFHNFIAHRRERLR
jgi:hypothetical protein